MNKMYTIINKPHSVEKKKETYLHYAEEKQRKAEWQNMQQMAYEMHEK